MKNFIVQDLDGENLFEGSKHDCKEFIRKNRVGRYRMKEAFPSTTKQLKVVTEEVELVTK